MTYFRSWAVPVLFLLSTTIYLPTIARDATVRSSTPTVSANTPTAIVTPATTPTATPTSTPTPAAVPGGTIPGVTETPTASPTPEVNRALDLVVQADEVPACFALSTTMTFTPTATSGWGASVLYESNCSTTQPYDSVYQRVQLYDTDVQAADAYDMLRDQYDAQHEVVFWVLDGFNETFGYATQAGTEAYWYFTVSRIDNILVTTGLLYPARSNAILNPTWNFFYTELVLEHMQE